MKTSQGASSVIRFHGRRANPYSHSCRARMLAPMSGAPVRSGAPGSVVKRATSSRPTAYEIATYVASVTMETMMCPLTMVSRIGRDDHIGIYVPGCEREAVHCGERLCGTLDENDRIQIGRAHV